MTKLLNLDEMLDVAHAIGLSEASGWQSSLEQIGSAMAAAIAENLGVESGEAHFEGAAFAGTCAGFWPAEPGQQCPEPLSHFDSSEWDDDNG